ncbi:MAG: SWIM zinc finger family protein [Bacteroidota bacterium]
MVWTEAHIREISPDPGSFQRGSRLARPEKWVSLGRNERTLWGSCKGSGKNPYLTAIDLKGPAYKCSCPVRKFPCKHAIGLMLMMADLPAAEVPDWVAEWLSKRDQRAGQIKTQSIDTAEKQAAREKRRLTRLENMRLGLEDLQQWLEDIIRTGLADVSTEGSDFWQKKAARLVDAQVRGLANRVAAIPQLFSQPDWQQKILFELGQLYLIAEAFMQVESLPEDLQADLNQLVGVNPKKADVLNQVGKKDRWLVLGKRIVIEDKMDIQRIWLQGQQSQEMALLLDFSVAGSPFENHFSSGQVIDGDLVYYPASVPQRALFQRSELIPAPFELGNAASSIDAFLTDTHQHFLQNPFLERLPALLESVRVLQHGEAYFIQDQSGDSLPIHPQFRHIWTLMAMSGGAHICVFGEWQTPWFFPLSALDQMGWKALSTI